MGLVGSEVSVLDLVADMAAVVTAGVVGSGLMSVVVCVGKCTSSVNKEVAASVGVSSTLVSVVGGGESSLTDLEYNVTP